MSAGRRGESCGDWEEFCSARTRFFEQLAQQSVLYRLEQAWAVGATSAAAIAPGGDAPRSAVSRQAEHALPGQGVTGPHGRKAILATAKGSPPATPT